MSTTDGRDKIVAIAGAGPAGLTAALELLRRSDMIPIVFEADNQVGGISKTVNYRGNRMDLGGHRFFSKSDWVMRWWQDILPLADGQLDAGKALRLAYQQQSRELLPSVVAPNSSDAVMLVRQRISRIFYRRRFFDYPLKLNAGTVRNMGLIETLRIGISYGQAQIIHRSQDQRPCRLRRVEGSKALVRYRTLAGMRMRLSRRRRYLRLIYPVQWRRHHGHAHHSGVLNTRSRRYRHVQETHIVGHPGRHASNHDFGCFRRSQTETP